MATDFWESSRSRCATPPWAKVGKAVSVVVAALSSCGELPGRDSVEPALLC